MTEHVILVAFTVETSVMGDRPTAHWALQKCLVPLLTEKDSPIQNWWVAEDDRDDGSDNDSAVFCKPGLQQVAARVLYAAGLTEECNTVRPTGGQFSPPPSAVHQAMVECINDLSKSPVLP